MLGVLSDSDPLREQADLSVCSLQIEPSSHLHHYIFRSLPMSDGVDSELPLFGLVDIACVRLRLPTAHLRVSPRLFSRSLGGRRFPLAK